MSEARPDIEKELSDLRREVIEARNLVIKTDNLLKNLHAELKMVSRRQEEFQKHQWISSAVAYALFTFVCVGGSLFFFIRSQQLSSQDRDRLERARSETAEQLERQKLETAANAAASREAAKAYEMMTNLQGDERLRGIDMLPKLDSARLSSLEKQALQDRSSNLHRELGLAALDRGRLAFRKNDMASAVIELTRFMGMNPTGEEASEASFMLGNAFSQLRKPDQAIPFLTRYLSGDRRAKNRDYAMLLLAMAYEQTGQFAKGLITVREALGNYPNSQFAPQLKNRLVSLKRASGMGSTDNSAPTANNVEQQRTAQP